MNYKEKARELSKLLAEYADSEDAIFEHKYILSNMTWFKTGGLPSMDSNLSLWRVSKPRKINWLKVPVNTLVNVRNFPSNKPLAHYFALFMPDSCNKFRIFSDGLLQSKAKALANWKYCEIHPSVEIQEEWYENEI